MDLQSIRVLGCLVKRRGRRDKASNYRTFQISDWVKLNNVETKANALSADVTTDLLEQSCT